MKLKQILSSSVTACAAAVLLNAPAWAATGVQVGASGKTYASDGIECALDPVLGMAPMVRAGLYNPKTTSKATVSLNGEPVTTVTFYNPDTSVWLANGINTINVALNKRTADNYTFDASLLYPGQPNACIPDTSGDNVAGDIETAASEKSSATVTPGCALNARTGRAKPYINLFDNGPYLLNVSVNNVPLTQLDGTRRTHTPALCPVVDGLFVPAGEVLVDQPLFPFAVQGDEGPAAPGPVHGL